MVNRLLSLYLAVVAVSVTAQFTTWTIYSKISDRAADVALVAWDVIGWCMLAGLLLTVFTTFREKRNSDPDSSGCARYCHPSNLLFYGAVLLTLAFMPNWFGGLWGEPPHEGTFWAVWYVIDTAVPVLFVVQSVRLWRSA